MFKSLLKNQIRYQSTVTFFTKQGCMLCSNASKILDDALLENKKNGTTPSMEKIDIMLPENSEWFEKYCYDVPVLHIKCPKEGKNEEILEKLNDDRKGIVAYNEGIIKFMHYFYKDKILNALKWNSN